MYIFVDEKNNFLEKMSKDIKLKKGLNINLSGEADKVYANVPTSKLYVVKPTDFHGLTPKLVVKEGDKVMSGSTLFFDKYNESIKFSSPVSGEVTSIVRGAKRRIMEVVITSDDEIKYKAFEKIDNANLFRDQIVNHMLESGVWPFIRQKPFDVIANLKI